MGTVYFIVFLIAEIILAVLTLGKKNDKSVWLKNRLIFRVAEAGVLFGLKTLPITHEKWRFAAAIIFLFILCLCDLIEWLIKRKKTVGKIIKARAVVSCVLSSLFILSALIPAFIFTNYNGLPTTGEYKVNEASTILVNEALLDPFENDGSNREVPVHFYYPDNAEGEYPLVVFSHGAFGYYQSNVSTYMELASNGYVVAALDHPHHSIFTNDTQGKTIIADQKFLNDVSTISGENVTEEEIYEITKSWMEIRTSDENFVLDTIEDAKKSGALSNAFNTQQADTIQAVLNMTDIEKIGLMGHSMGGAASVAVGRERSDIDAVIDIDGTMLGEQTGFADGKYVINTEPYAAPLLSIDNEAHHNDRLAYRKTGYVYANNVVLDRAENAYETYFAGAGHMNFTDLPLISPVLADALGTGDIDPAECTDRLNSLILSFFNCYLKDQGEFSITE